MRVRAFAKINLSLRVVGRRSDGYHDLRTVFQSIALHDTLHVRPAAGGLTIACSDAACPVGRSNLVWRAAEMVWRVAGRRGAPRGAAVRIEKRIPMEAGLGGGSADAAAAVRAFASLWAPALSYDALHRIAVALGADVPFFFEGGTALGLDRGDVLYPLADPPTRWVVVAVPPFGVSTGDAFAWWDAGNTRSPERAAPQPSNDLQPVVARRHPEIARLVNELAKAGALHSAMSGSGSAVFGLFSSRAAAIRAARRLAAPEVRLLVTKSLNRRVYQRLAGSGLPRRQPIVYT